jgi:sensor histidine kinase YesM
VFLILITILYLSNAQFFNIFIDQARQLGIPENHVFYKFINEQKRIMNKVFLIGGSLSFLVIFFGGLYLSNKVAGPLYRLTKFLNERQQGDQTQLKFRKGDYFLEVQDAINKYLNKQ